MLRSRLCLLLSTEVLNGFKKAQSLATQKTSFYYSTAANNLNKPTNESNECKTEKRTNLLDLLSQSEESKADVKFYDPPYLKKEPPFPNYELLNINIKGYDYTVIGKYFEYIERLCNALKISVVEAYAMPARNLKIKTYQPYSSNLDKEYKLNVYHRIVRVQNLKSTLAPFLLEALQLNLPEGVQLSVTIPTLDEDEFRYVPDIELNELKKQLDEMTKKPKEASTAEASKTTASPPKK